MNFMKTIVAAGLVAASTSAFARRHHRSGLRRSRSPIYSKWADAYKKETGNGLNYQSIGSGGGIKQIEAKDRDVRGHRYAAEGRAVGKKTVWCSGRWSWARSFRWSILRA